MSEWGTFLEYAGIKTTEKGKESYSGIDGGDINAEYWFMGMEWSNIKDIKDDYNYLYNCWRMIKKIPDEINIKKNPSDWMLENALDILYHMLMPEFADGKTIFQKNSNSFKLNLLPLPFLDNNAKTAWKDTHLTEATGFSCFKEYMAGVLEARHKLFQKLLTIGKCPKTIFCFGKGENKIYEKRFVQALTGKSNLKPTCEEPLDSKSSGYAVKVCVYDIKDNDYIRRILVCPFPYTPSYTFNKNDWEKICNLARKENYS